MDALRGIAAVYVVCFHLTLLLGHVGMPDFIGPLILSGANGVTLFFVISAFTLSISWFSRKNDPHRVRNFYLRRIWRIAPLFYVLLAVMLLGDWHLWHKLPSLKEMMLNASMLFNLAPESSRGIVRASWTIGVEILFYLLFPMIIRMAATPGRLVVCFIGTIVLAILSDHGVQHSHLSSINKAEFYNTSVALQLPVFVLGIVAYRIYASKLFWKMRVRPMGGILIAAAAIYYVLLVYIKMGASIRWSAPAWTLLVLGLVLNPVTPMVNAVTRFYGRISYSVYLNHLIVLALLKPCYVSIYRHASGRGLALFTCGVVTFLIVTPCAYITYRLIEQPGILFGGRLIKSLDLRAKGSDSFHLPASDFRQPPSDVVSVRPNL